MFIFIENRRLAAFVGVLLALTGVFSLPSHGSPQGRVTEDANPQPPIENGLELFDGNSLKGWVAESEANWAVHDQAIHVSEGKPGLLRTTSQFDYFDLELEFWGTETTNSGVFVLTSPRPTNPAIDCYEVNIINPTLHEFATGGIVARAKSVHAPNLTEGQWHRLRIQSLPSGLKVWVDEELASTYVDPKPLGRGYIGLQFNKGSAAFRNIRLCPREMAPIFDGGSLRGWNVDRLQDAKTGFPEDGVLELSGGPGQLESDNPYQDFVLSVEAKVTEANSNSGVFFRCIPQEFLNGYECQINHQLNDQQQPADCGTGGIFRRQDATALFSRDHEWFRLTLVVVGPHVSTWVNGKHVADWVDDRKPDVNPRRGLRLEAGTIALQAHDPTTRIDFRNIQIHELTRRQR